jgi:hypothetical protein
MNIADLLILSIPATMGVMKLGILALTVVLAARVIFQAQNQPSTVPATLRPAPRYPHRAAG